MRKKRFVPLVVAGPLLALGVAGVAPADALTCPAHPDGSPQAIASGTERLSTQEDFFDKYDYAIIGTVTEIHTVAVGETDYGATTVSVDVVAVLGEGTAQQRIEISSPDSGWMAGYPYEAGTAYLIPIRRTGPEGQANYSFVCDPIAEVDVGIASNLRQLAADAGIPFSTPDMAPVPASAGDRDDDDDEGAAVGAPSDEGATVGAPSDSAMPAAAVALALGVALIVGAIVLRTRARATPTSS